MSTCNQLVGLANPRISNGCVQKISLSLSLSLSQPCANNWWQWSSSSKLAPNFNRGGGRIVYCPLLITTCIHNMWMTNNKGESVCVAPVPFNALTKLRLRPLLCGCHHFCNHSGHLYITPSPSLYKLAYININIYIKKCILSEPESECHRGRLPKPTPNRGKRQHSRRPITQIK